MGKAITTEGAPSAIGPYSQAISVGNTVWLSGQIALDPASMELVGSTAEDQTRQIIKNMNAVLEAAGATFEDLVFCTIFLANMNDFDAVNTVYGQFMPTPAPARATVEVSRLPKDARVEISAVACIGDSTA